MTAPERPPDLQELLNALADEASVPRPEALEHLRARLHAIAHARMKRGDGLRRSLDSEDLAHEALFDLIRNIHLFRGTTWPEFHAFLDSVLQRRKTDLARFHNRLRRRAHPASLSDDSVDLPAALASPASNLIRAEDLARIKRMVEELPPDLSTVIRLRLEPLDHAAIAERLGISEPAARKRLSRAIAELRRVWRDGDAAGSV